VINTVVRPQRLPISLRTVVSQLGGKTGALKPSNSEGTGCKPAQVVSRAEPGRSPPNPDVFRARGRRGFGPSPSLLLAAIAPASPATQPADDEPTASQPRSGSRAGCGGCRMTQPQG